jgi:chromosome segregation ATPase
MADDFDDGLARDEPQGLRALLARQGEESLGRLAHDLLDNPLVNAAVSRAFEAREKAAQAQEVAFGALNLPSAADVERLTRRVRSVAQRLEGIEDGIDRLDERLIALQPKALQDRLAGLGERLGAIEEQLGGLGRELVALREALPDGRDPVPSSQERLRMEEPGQ